MSMSMEMMEVAIDLETLSTRSDAAIISVAAVPFHSVGDTGLGDEHFYEVVDATSCALYGMHFDMATVNFWAGQDDSAKDMLRMKPGIGIRDALTRLRGFLSSLKDKYGCELRIWCQGTDFDIPVLKNAYAKVLPDSELPWKYNQVFDSRTYILTRLEELYGIEERPYDRIPRPDGDGWIKHSALGDAFRLVENVKYIRGLCQNPTGHAISGTIPK